MTEKNDFTPEEREKRLREFFNVPPERRVPAHPTPEVKEEIERGLKNTREVIKKAVEKAKAAEAKAKVQQIPQKADELLNKSRQSRLKAEREGGPTNSLQKFFDAGAQGWAMRTVVEIIPVAGDIVTGYGAVMGSDVLTGRKLDKVDRVIYGVATAIPGVPGILIADPVRAIRIALEDWHYEKQTQKDEETVKQVNLLGRAITQLVKIIQQGGNKRT